MCERDCIFRAFRSFSLLWTSGLVRFEGSSFGRFSCCIVDATCSFDPSLPLGRDREEGGLISFSSVTGSNRNLRVEAKHPFHVMYLLSRILTAGFWNQPCLGTWMRTRM